MIINTVSKIKNNINCIKDNIKTIDDELSKQFEFLEFINEEKTLQIKNLQNEIDENIKIMNKVTFTNLSTEDNIFLSIRNIVNIITTDVIIYNNFKIRTIKAHVEITPQYHTTKFYFSVEDLDNMLYCEETTLKTTTFQLEAGIKIELINIMKPKVTKYSDLILKYGRGMLGWCFLEETALWSLLNATNNSNKEAIILFFRQYIKLSL